METLRMFKVVIMKGIAFYTVACDLNSAYRNVRTVLDEQDKFFASERDFSYVTVVGEPLKKIQEQMIQKSCLNIWYS